MARTLTVVMPVYNAMPYVKEAVASILHQTYRDFRLLVVDDGSTDGSAAFLNSISDPRVEVRHQNNMGEYATTNLAIASVDSEFIAILHADDVAVPNRLEKQLDVLASHPDLACVLSNYTLVYNNIASVPCWAYGEEEVSSYTSQRYSSITPTTLCCRRNVWLELGGFRTFLPNVGDYDFLLRCEEKFPIAVINTPLVRYRHHRVTKTNTQYFEQQFCLRYVAAMAHRRRAGRSEIGLEEFREKEKLDAFFLRARRAARTTAKLMRLRSGILRSERKYCRAALSLIGVCLLWPSFAFKKAGGGLSVPPVGRE
jgi:glycosyltransferase involved in cell wall biosynthesis